VNIGVMRRFNRFIRALRAPDPPQRSMPPERRLFAVGVGQKKDPIPDMNGTEGGSR
jgi:hypothetical protein